MFVVHAFTVLWGVHLNARLSFHFLMTLMLFEVRDSHKMLQHTHLLPWQHQGLLKAVTNMLSTAHHVNYSLLWYCWLSVYHCLFFKYFKMIGSSFPILLNKSFPSIQVSTFKWPWKFKKQWVLLMKTPYWALLKCMFGTSPMVWNMPWDFQGNIDHLVILSMDKFKVLLNLVGFLFCQ